MIKIVSDVKTICTVDVTEYINLPIISKGNPIGVIEKAEIIDELTVRIYGFIWDRFFNFDVETVIFDKELIRLNNHSEEFVGKSITKDQIVNGIKPIGIELSI